MAFESDQSETGLFSYIGSITQKLVCYRTVHPISQQNAQTSQPKKELWSKTVTKTKSVQHQKLFSGKIKCKRNCLLTINISIAREISTGPKKGVGVLQVNYMSCIFSFVDFTLDTFHLFSRSVTPNQYQ